jgi:putative acetyltransferase
MKTEAFGYRLRPAAQSDGPQVMALVFGVLREHGLEPDPEGTDADLMDLESRYHGAGGSFDVVEEAATGRLIGSVGLLPCGGGTVELRKMYLEAGYRGLGIGRWLLDQALIRARELGFKRVTLETASELARAVELYQRAGFRRCEAGHLAARCDQRMELWLDGAENPS